MNLENDNLFKTKLMLLIAQTIFECVEEEDIRIEKDIELGMLLLEKA